MFKEFKEIVLWAFVTPSDADQRHRLCPSYDPPETRILNGVLFMFRLALFLFSMVATSLAGTGVIIALVSGHDTLMPILYSAAAGFIAAIPVTYVIARKITELR
ncbi:hypothetical protein [Pseudohalocynthiibacter sp. F2068]